MIHREPLVVTGAFRASAWRGEHAPLTVLTTSVATTAAAAIGSLTTSKSVMTWYPTLRKPSFTPPRAAFPIAWTALYADTAVTTAAAYDRLRSDGRDAEPRALAGALGVNLERGVLRRTPARTGCTPCRRTDREQRRSDPSHRVGEHPSGCGTGAVSAVVCVRDRPVDADLATEPLIGACAHGQVPHTPPDTGAFGNGG